MASAFIPDGYNLKGYVNGETQGSITLWDPCRFKYRPATAPESEELKMLASPAEMQRRRAAFVANHLVEWDLRFPAGCVVGGKHVGGEIVPITPENVGRLYGPFRTRLIQIIEGSYFSDEDPQDTGAEPIQMQEQAGN